MSPKVPKAYLEARRTEIKHAAYKCFVEKGFHNTTMQDIYNATNLSPGAVYNYFDSKEDIVINSIREYGNWSLASLSSMITENPDETFIKYFRFLFSDIIQNDTAKNFSSTLDFYSEATRNVKIREILIKFMNATGEKLAVPVKRNQRAGLFNPGLDPAMIGHVMVGMVFAAAIHRMIEPDFDIESFRQVCEAMLNGTFASPDKKGRKTSQLLTKLRKAEEDYKDRH